MKKTLFLLSFIVFQNSFSQINETVDFTNGLPSNWSASSNTGTSADNPSYQQYVECSPQDKSYFIALTVQGKLINFPNGFIESSSYNVNNEKVKISFDAKILDQANNYQAISIDKMDVKIQYSDDNGNTWIDFGVIDQQNYGNSTSCTNYSFETSTPITSSALKVRFYVELANGGNYYIFVLDNIKLESTSATSISSFNSSKSNIFPNPVKEYLTVNSEFEIKSYKIYDLSGKEIMISNNEAFKSKNLDTQNLSKGTYFIILYGDKFVESHKFIK